ncbi:MAG: EAL domain-containing protein, partial [Thiohalorhabdaceae bacterium]
LLRMQDGGSPVGPAEFLPVAERFSLMGEVDRWVIHQAIAQLAHWRRKRPGLSFCINLSARAFGDQALFDEIREAIEGQALEPSALVLEITETEAIANLTQAKAMIWTLRELGCRFALDDFGSGFASFTYLRELPVDMVKIDGNFIRDMAFSGLDRTRRLWSSCARWGFNSARAFTSADPPRNQPR